MQKTLIIIPTYQEVDNIDYLLSSIMSKAPSVHLLLVDDNSQDGTIERIRSFQGIFPEKIHLLQRPGKLGLGTAYLAGFHWGLARPYDFFVQMDADLSHQPSHLGPLLDRLAEGQDLVIGSRYVAGGMTENWSLIRRLISRAGSLYARVILGLSIRDLTGGFNAWRRDLLEKIDLPGVHSNGYCFQIEMKYRARQQTQRIAEMPIKFVERREGKSKMSLGIVLEAIYKVWQIRWKLGPIVQGGRV